MDFASEFLRTLVRREFSTRTMAGSYEPASGIFDATVEWKCHFGSGKCLLCDLIKQLCLLTPPGRPHFLNNTFAQGF